MRAIAIFPEKKKIELIKHEAPHITSDTQVKLRILEVIPTAEHVGWEDKILASQGITANTV